MTTSSTLLNPTLRILACATEDIALIEGFAKNAIDEINIYKDYLGLPHTATVPQTVARITQLRSLELGAN